MLESFDLPNLPVFRISEGSKTIWNPWTSSPTSRQTFLLLSNRFITLDYQNDKIIPQTMTKDFQLYVSYNWLYLDDEKKYSFVTKCVVCTFFKQ